MTPVAPAGARRLAFSPLGIVGVLAGAALFAWYLRAVGLNDIAEAVRRIGVGFVWVLALSGLRLALRAAAWVQCVDEGQLRFRPALSAFLAGDALGNLTPLGPVASEGLKVVLARRYVRGLTALSSVALENLFYTLTVAVVLVVGALAFLIGFHPDSSIRTGGLIVVGAAGAVLAAACWWLFGQPRLLSRASQSIAAWHPPSGLRARLEKLQELDDRIHRFSARHPRRVAMVLLLESVFQAASIAEIYLLLALLVGPTEATLLQAVALEAMNRVTMVLFKFVPLRVGVDEAGSGLLSQALALGSVPGVAIALTRKARTVVWSAVGLALLVHEGLSVSSAMRQAEAVAETSSTTDGD